MAILQFDSKFTFSFLFLLVIIKKVNYAWLCLCPVFLERYESTELISAGACNGSAFGAIGPGLRAAVLLPFLQ